MNDDEKFVRSIWPGAYLKQEGAIVTVRRVRLKTDSDALTTPYVLLSGTHFTAEEAWRDAAAQLRQQVCA